MVDGRHLTQEPVRITEVQLFPTIDQRLRFGEIRLELFKGRIDSEAFYPYAKMVNLGLPEFVQLELRNMLIAALDSLPEDYRAIVVLRDVENLSLQEVSQITGLSVGVVKTRTHRARLVLRKRLGEYLSDRPLSLSRPLRRRDDGRVHV
jgi:Sigma-70, region 4